MLKLNRFINTVCNSYINLWHSPLFLYFFFKIFFYVQMNEVSGPVVQVMYMENLLNLTWN